MEDCGIGKRVRALRKKIHWSQETLAQRVKRLAPGSEVSQQTISQIETGENNSLRYLVPVARALGTTAEWLWDETGPGPMEPWEVEVLARLNEMTPDERRHHLFVLGIKYDPSDEGTPPKRGRKPRAA